MVCSHGCLVDGPITPSSMNFSLARLKIFGVSNMDFWFDIMCLDRLRHLPLTVRLCRACQYLSAHCRSTRSANMGRPLLKSISAEATNISSDGWLGMTMFPLAKEASSTSTRRSTSPRGQVMRSTEQHGWHLWSPRRRTTRLILESQK